jgi:hypothetical protein
MLTCCQRLVRVVPVNKRRRENEGDARMKLFSTRLSAELIRRLKTLAASEETSVQALAREALEKLLAERSKRERS